MKLYVDKAGTAPSPRRVRMYLAEKGLEIPVEWLELPAAVRTPAFRAKNPVGTLPVLELDDGRCIAESIAICRYFEELHPEPPLFGRTPLEKAEIEMWTRRVEQYFYLPLDFSGLFARKPLAPEVSAFFARWAGLAAGLFDQTVRERPFLAGDRLSIADLFAYGALDYGVKHRGYAIPAELTSLQAWYATMGARPSAAA
jgi:glutathione S-transferase